MKIAIVGAGAVGGYAGAHMVQAGEDVVHSGQHVRQLVMVLACRREERELGAQSAAHPAVAENEAEHAGVEVDVARGVARDRRDVVDAVEVHRSLPFQDCLI